MDIIEVVKRSVFEGMVKMIKMMLKMACFMFFHEKRESYGTCHFTTTFCVQNCLFKIKTLYYKNDMAYINFSIVNKISTFAFILLMKKSEREDCLEKKIVCLQVLRNKIAKLFV